MGEYFLHYRSNKNETYGFISPFLDGHLLTFSKELETEADSFISFGLIAG